MSKDIKRTKRTNRAKRTKRTPPQYAQQLGVSNGKVLDFIRSGELRAINIATSRDGRPRYVIDVADIEAFERGREIVPSAEPTRRLRKSASDVTEYF